MSASARVELQTSSDIAAGEAEAILIAADVPDASVLLIDDRRARRVAMARGVRTFADRSPLVAAAQRRLLQPGEVREALETLQHERYLDSRAVDDILALLNSA